MKNYIFPLGFLEKIQFLIKFHRVAQKYKKDTTIHLILYHSSFTNYQFFSDSSHHMLKWCWIKKIHIWKDSLLLYAFIPADHKIHDGQ